MAQSNSDGAWLQKGTPEYDQVYFYLKSCLSPVGSGTVLSPFDNAVTSTVKIGEMEVWKINNPDHLYQYEQRTKNLLKLACWKPSISNENDVNSIENICSYGYRIPNGGFGLEFTTGILELGVPASSKHSTLHTFVYSEIGVGRAYVCDRIDIELPTGFDSLYITPFPLDRNRDGKFSLTEYRSAARFDYRDARSKQNNHSQ